MIESAGSLMRAARPITLGLGAVGVNAGVDSVTNVNLMGTLMFPNPIHSITAGMTIGAVFGKGTFSGAFGYKTLLTGITSGASNISAGGLILPMVELGAKGLVKMGASNKYVIAAQSARRTGIAGIGTTVEFKNRYTMLRSQQLLSKDGLGPNSAGKLLGEDDWKKLARKELFSSSADENIVMHADGTFRGVSRTGLKANLSSSNASIVIDDAWNAANSLNERGGWKVGMGIAGKDSNSITANGTWVTTKTKGGDRIASVTSGKDVKNFMIKNAKLGAALRWVGVMDMISLGAGVAMWAGGLALDGAAQAISFGIRNIQQAERLELGQRQLSPVFAAPTAATERRRAIQAIYGARVNPAEKMFGNEARYMHR